jgi:hypothetical protein
MSRSLKTGNNGTPLKITLFSSEEFNFEASPNAPNTCTGGRRPVWSIRSTEWPNAGGAYQFPFVIAGYDNCCGFVEWYCYNPGTNTHTLKIGAGGPDFTPVPDGILFQDPNTSYIAADPGFKYNTDLDQLQVCANTANTTPQVVICQENSGDAALNWQLANTVTNTDAAGFTMGIDHSVAGFPLVISVGNTLGDPAISIDNTGSVFIKKLCSKTASLVKVSTNTTIDPDACVYTILVDASAGNTVITLPNTVLVPEREYRVSKIDNTLNWVTIKGHTGAQTISGATQIDLKFQHETLDTQCDNTEWWIL